MVKGWAPFTDAIIEVVAAHPGPIVFLLWGRHAKAKAHLIDRERHIIHEAGHPSPFSYRHYFQGRAGFVEANEALAARGLPVIDWNLS